MIHRFSRNAHQENKNGILCVREREREREIRRESMHGDSPLLEKLLKTMLGIASLSTM